MGERDGNFGDEVESREITDFFGNKSIETTHEDGSRSVSREVTDFFGNTSIETVREDGRTSVSREVSDFFGNKSTETEHQGGGRSVSREASDFFGNTSVETEHQGGRRSVARDVSDFFGNTRTEHSNAPRSEPPSSVAEVIPLFGRRDRSSTSSSDSSEGAPTPPDAGASSSSWGGGGTSSSPSRSSMSIAWIIVPVVLVGLCLLVRGRESADPRPVSSSSVERAPPRIAAPPIAPPPRVAATLRPGRYACTFREYGSTYNRRCIVRREHGGALRVVAHGTRLNPHNGFRSSSRAPPRLTRREARSTRSTTAPARSARRCTRTASRIPDRSS